MEEKREASEVFRRGWEVCREDEGYLALKRAFQKEQKEWDKAHRGRDGEVKEGKKKGVKKEDTKKEDVKKEKVVKGETKVKEESDEG
jgi:hypothetical protein